ncbi:hypothetical protein B0H11DRAFT_1007290 [Mycena galericulata]|nr:hypothetical protein B0H11DRAFT_1007290 [Mycena galericulata]
MGEDARWRRSSPALSYDGAGVRGRAGERNADAVRMGRRRQTRRGDRARTDAIVKAFAPHFIIPILSPSRNRIGAPRPRSIRISTQPGAAKGRPFELGLRGRWILVPALLPPPATARKRAGQTSPQPWGSVGNWSGDENFVSGSGSPISPGRLRPPHPHPHPPSPRSSFSTSVSASPVRALPPAFRALALALGPAPTSNLAVAHTDSRTFLSAHRPHLRPRLLL